jgi:tryptophan-rich sensory protein
VEGGWKVQGRALGLFLGQWLLNTLWTPLFFGLHQMGLAFAEIVLLWIMIALTTQAFWKVKRSAGLLMLPYLAWVSFAAVLNFTLWRMNGWTGSLRQCIPLVIRLLEEQRELVAIGCEVGLRDEL